jgi:CHAT domain-containing protein
MTRFSALPGALFLAALLPRAQVAKTPQTILAGPLSNGFAIKQTIGPNLVHRYVLPNVENLYLHVLIYQISVDVAVRIKREDGTVVAEVDATNLGWESVPVILHDGGFLDVELRDRKGQGGRYELMVKDMRAAGRGDEEHAEAAIAATEARRSAAPGTNGSIDAAIQKYKHVLNLWRNCGDSQGELMTLLSLATLSYMSSQYQQGAEYSRQALGFARSSKDRADEGLALNNLAMSELAVADLEPAREHLTDAAEAFQETGSAFAVAAAKINLGLLDDKTGHWSDSLLEYGEARTLTREIGDRRLGAYAIDHIAQSYLALGDNESASSFLQQALDAFNRARDLQAAARAKSNLGRVKLRVGRANEAERLLRESLDQLHMLPDRRAEANALNYLGQALETRSRAEARIQYEKALAMFRSVGDRGGESSALYNLGRLSTANGEVESAIEFLNRSLAIRREIGVFDLEAEGLYSLAVAERSRGNLLTAQTDIEEALRNLDSSRRQAPGEWLRSNYLATRGEMYEFAIDLSMELYRRGMDDQGAERAFRIHERGLARSLIDRLGISQEEIVQGVDGALLRKFKQLQDLIGFRSTELLQIFEKPHKPSEEASARAKLESASAEYRLLDAQIRASSTEYRNLVEPSPPTIEEIQWAIIGKQDLLLEFSLGEPRSYLWAITDSDFRWYILPGQAQMERWAIQFLGGLSRSGSGLEPKSGLGASRALGAILRQPLADHAGKNRLLIVAEGKLLQLPFAAIQIPSATRGQFQYLIDSWEPSMLPSASAGIQLRRRARNRPSPTRGIAIFADPVFGADDERFPRAGVGPSNSRLSTRYPRLAFTRQEAEAILSLKPSPGNLKALDFAANVWTAKKELGAYRIAHFSTHTTMDQLHPESAGLVFSMVDRNGHEQDGVLRIPAIVQIPLQADLAVLSACETASGDEIKTEGIFGLTQAFIYAGAQQVVSSVWPVDDFTTREFMTRFYQSLLLRGLSPPAAMRATQLSMKHTKAFSAPFAWAGFIVYGYSE